jgi:hypothetical protein
MYKIDRDETKGTIIISEFFSESINSDDSRQAPEFNDIGEEYILEIGAIENGIEGVKKLREFTYNASGLDDGKFLIPQYRVSRNNTTWTNWLNLNKDIDNFPKIDPKDKFYLEIKWRRVGISDYGTIKILNYRIDGILDRNMDIFPTNGTGLIIEDKETKIIHVPFIFKVFRIDDVEVISRGGIDNVQIKYRYSQDNSRTWSEWEPLTKENISTRNINPIRFFQIEYLIEGDPDNIVKINDINLIGDFQNITKDYEKSNLLGIRECCQSNLLGTFDSDGNFIPNTNLNSGMGGGEFCDGGVFAPMTDENRANLYNPYAQTTAGKLLEKLSADSEQVFGHRVTYFSTDPDEKGQDHILNEYQLYNIVCQSDLKISVVDNSFPDSQIKMNVFDLELFESMEVHVTKKQFKEVFGKQRRPAKEDFIFFCDLNRMFQVDHAQQFRNFNNSAVYYKLILKKYNKKSNVRAANIEIKNKLENLTKNSTIDELMGVEQTKDKAAVANKPQFTPLTRDPIRLNTLADIDKELIENSTVIISKSNYDLSSVKYRQPAVIYKNLRPTLRVSDNIGYQIWFNINNYIENEIYSFIDAYDEVNSVGWKSELKEDVIVVTLNSDTYSFPLSEYENGGTVDALEEEVWYCYVLNIDQRQRKIEQFIYKRNVDEESEAIRLSNSFLRLVNKISIDISEPVEFFLEKSPQLVASDMKVTNIRLFVDIIPENLHNKILNQYVIADDSKYLVFADNANTRLILGRLPFNE